MRMVTNVDPDHMASLEASLSVSTLLSKAGMDFLKMMQSLLSD